MQFWARDKSAPFDFSFELLRHGRALAPKPLVGENTGRYELLDEFHRRRHLRRLGHSHRHAFRRQE